MLNPDEIASRQFLIQLRGYDRDEVQTFLKEVAEEQRDLQTKLKAAEAEVAKLRAELDNSRTLASASGAAVPDDDTSSSAAAPAASTPAAGAEPRAVFAALGEETTRILVAAEESARNIRERAEERARVELESARREAREEVAGARRTAAKIVADAERRRNGVAEEIRRLEVTRDRFSEDLRGAMVAVQNAMRGLTGGGAPAGQAAPTAVADASSDDDDPARAGARPTALAAEAREFEVDDAALRSAAREAEADAQARALAETPLPRVAPAETDAAASADAVLDQIQAELDAAEQDEVVEVDLDVDHVPSAIEQAAQQVLEDDPIMVDEAGDGPSTDEIEIVELEPVVDLDDGPEAGVEDAPITVEAEEDDDAVVLDEPAAVSLPEADAPTLDLDAPTVSSATSSAALDLRSGSLDAIRPGMLRVIKRGLQDVQNGVLDHLRRQGDEPSLDGLLPDDAALGTISDIGRRHLADAFVAGRNDGGLLANDSVALTADDESGVVATIATLKAVFAHEITTGLQATLTAGIDAGEASTSLSERVGEVFRDLKGPITENVVEQHLMRAYSWGVLSAWDELGIEGKQWVRGDEVRCPEDMCAQNAAMGPLPLEAPFATGDVVPPPHDGCDCALAPAEL